MTEDSWSCSSSPAIPVYSAHLLEGNELGFLGKESKILKSSQIRKEKVNKGFWSSLSWETCLRKQKMDSSYMTLVLEVHHLSTLQRAPGTG